MLRGVHRTNIWSGASTLCYCNSGHSYIRGYTGWSSKLPTSQVAQGTMLRGVHCANIRLLIIHGGHTKCQRQIRILGILLGGVHHLKILVKPSFPYLHVYRLECKHLEQSAISYPLSREIRDTMLTGGSVLSNWTCIRYIGWNKFL